MVQLTRQSHQTQVFVCLNFYLAHLSISLIDLHLQFVIFICSGSFIFLCEALISNKILNWSQCQRGFKDGSIFMT